MRSALKTSAKHLELKVSVNMTTRNVLLQEMTPKYELSQNTQAFALNYGVVDVYEYYNI